MFNIITSLKNKAILVLILLVMLLSFLSYYYINKYNKVTKSLQIQKRSEKQNKEYWESIIVQKSDSIQILSGLIINLNKDISLIKDKYVSQNELLQIQIEKLKSTGSGLSSNGEDSLGQYLQVKFKGKESILSFDGFTRHYFKLNKDIYNLNFVFDSIYVFSEFYMDKDKIWRVKSKSLVPGIVLKVDYKIDSTFYYLYQNNNENISYEKKDISHLVGLRLRSGIVGNFIPNNTLYNRYFFDFSAEIYYRGFYFTYHPFYKAGELGIFYDLDLTKVFSMF